MSQTSALAQINELVARLEAWQPTTKEATDKAAQDLLESMTKLRELIRGGVPVVKEQGTKSFGLAAIVERADQARALAFKESLDLVVKQPVKKETSSQSYRATGIAEIARQSGYGDWR